MAPQSESGRGRDELTSTRGLAWGPRFYRDRLFHMALLAGAAFGGGL
jgi:hypothetical protein